MARPVWLKEAMDVQVRICSEVYIQIIVYLGQPIFDARGSLFVRC